MLQEQACATRAGSSPTGQNMRGGNDVARGLGSDVVRGIAGGEGHRRVHRAIGQFARRAAAQVRLQVASLRDRGARLAFFQGPLLLGRIDQAQVVDTRILLRGGAGPNEVGNGDGRQKPNDGNHYHDFHQREGPFASSFHFHTIAFFERREPAKSGLLLRLIVHFIAFCHRIPYSMPKSVLEPSKKDENLAMAARLVTKSAKL